MSDENDERFTLPSTMAVIKDWLRVEAFDLDVAACAQSFHAKRFYTKADNGLVKPWDAELIFCNPPWTRPWEWVARSWCEWWYRKDIRLVAMVLPGNRAEQPGWQVLVESHRDRQLPESMTLRTKYLPGRTRYGSPEDPAGADAGSPNFNSVVLAWDRR